MDPKVKEQQIMTVKLWRKELNYVATEIAILDVSQQSRETSLAITKIQEGIMWLGMELKRLNGGVSCYPEGMNPNNATVDPAPDDVLNQGTTLADVSGRASESQPTSDEQPMEPPTAEDDKKDTAEPALAGQDV